MIKSPLFLPGMLCNAKISKFFNSVTLAKYPEILTVHRILLASSKLIAFEQQLY